MRRIVLYLLTLFLLVIAVLIVIKGITIGPIEIDNYQTILEENEKLDDLISVAETQKETKYPAAISQQQTVYKTLLDEKQSYNELLEYGVDENGVPLSKIQEYEIEKIWITLGNYAKTEGVELKIDVTINNSVAETYDLNFTVIGEYIQIADFLYDIQRDTTLVFKIDEFKLVTAVEAGEDIGTNTDTSTKSTNKTTEETDEDSEEEIKLMATFVCKDIKLNVTDADKASENATSSETTTGTEATTTSTSTQTTTQN